MTDFTDLSKSFDALWVNETTAACSLVTSREDGDRMNPNILSVRDYIWGLTKSFNDTQSTAKLQPFQWCANGSYDEGHESLLDPTDDQILNHKFYVFGLRIGAPKPKYKITVICHVDTVPADPDSSWNPFTPSIKMREYPGGTVTSQPFLVGRGCVDDKGPAFSSFLIARCFAKSVDGTDQLDNVQVEFLFDSSEETNMSTPIYFEDDESKVRIPDFGVVYDAFWIVRAEKGGERPKFVAGLSERAPAKSAAPLYVKSLITTPVTSTNTIADWAEATVCGDREAVAEFGASVDELYASFEFDDPDYRRAEMTSTVADDGASVLLHAKVDGAQHGSAPEENRKDGANPLVSLANFVAGLVRAGKLGPTPSASMACFIADTWGTHVFGEGNDDLYKFDEIFEEGNGTTYAVTKTVMDYDDAPDAIRLEIDIRYATGHHDYDKEKPVDEGFLPGDFSIFEAVFNKIVDEFNSKNADLAKIDVSTETLFPPDIRRPKENEHLQRVQTAFESVMGYSASWYAIGGGTDAKGYTFMVGIGPLFATPMGYPINYHGLGEGAPMVDMKKSTEILYTVLENEVQEVQKGHVKTLSKKDVRACLDRIRELSKRGFKHTCMH